MITKKVLAKVKETKVFAIISDEVQDVSSIKQITVVLRFVSIKEERYVVTKSFVGFKEQHGEMIGDAIASTTLKILEELGLNCE